MWSATDLKNGLAMKIEGINFPVYRKYKNNKSYFKIINPRLFEEIQVIGSRNKVKQIEVKIYPEMSFLRDLILNYGKMADEITKEEYELVRNAPNTLP
jgi:hypothetical protein